MFPDWFCLAEVPELGGHGMLRLLRLVVDTTAYLYLQKITPENGCKGQQKREVTA